MGLVFRLIEHNCSLSARSLPRPVSGPFESARRDELNGIMLEAVACR